MTMYYDSNFTLIRLIATFICVFIIGFFSCKLIDDIHGDDTKPLLHGFSYGNGSLYTVDMKICFANKTLLDRFLANDNETIFKLTVPCPEFKPPVQEDESGK